MKISSTESIAAAGPVDLSRKLFKEPILYGAISAIYVKPSSDLVYLLKKKSGPQYYITEFSTTTLAISYKKAFYTSYYSDVYSPRGIFKDENDYFAALNFPYYIYY
jgi:hypothetical protein